MRFVLFYHSVRSDWNHGNAHFLRGVARELLRRGHEVTVYEPRDAWSVQNLLCEVRQLDAPREPLRALHQAYPELRSLRYRLDELPLDQALRGADVVIVHEWNEPALVRRINQHRASVGRYLLLFHDTHHRSATAPHEMSRYDLSHHDAVLAFGDVVRDWYRRRASPRAAFTWHEAADTTVFSPQPDISATGDLVWIGNWGDNERTSELREFLIEPVRQLRLRANAYGVRYPSEAVRELEQAGITYRGWLPNFRVPRAFAQHRLTLHIPRAPYVQALPGIPTIRVFEALACGIPLICAPWNDCEGLFTPGEDYLVARDGKEMRSHLRTLLESPQSAAALAAHGRRTVLARHTCAHRVDELFDIINVLRSNGGSARAAPALRPLSHGIGIHPTMRIAFFGSSLVSAYWNGAATYYRGILKALHDRGHHITFYEPDAFDRQKHRDIEAPPYARSVIYSAEGEQAVRAALQDAKHADLIVKASGVGVFDALLERAVLDLQRTDRRVIFWDVDAPATLERVQSNPNDSFRALIPRYDMVFTYGGGDPVKRAYESLGAKRCVPVYNALDPETHFPVERDPRFESSLGFLGNRMPDRELRVREFFFEAARRLPERKFLLGGNGWEDSVEDFLNVQYLGHVYTRDHNAFNCTPTAVLNISRDSMARFGFSPATRVFEAAGAGAALITDAWEGIEQFLEPETECLVARSGAEVAGHLAQLTPARAAQLGEAARARVLAQHTYAQRAAQAEAALDGA